VRPAILIVGQGLAGTLLAWELERAGILFAIADAGHAAAATCPAAGVINPIPGRPLVMSWRVEALLPAARVTYRELEAALRVPLWHELRVRRLFADEHERRVFADKRSGAGGSDASGRLAPFAGEADDAGFWIEGAARVDLAALLGAARGRWQRQRRLRAESVTPAGELRQYDLVIDCTGVGGTAAGGAFDFVPWEFSKGEILALAVDGLAPGVILHRGHWVVPVGPGEAWVGVTREPGVVDGVASAAARTALEASARSLIGGPFTVNGQVAGVRVDLPDERPVVGRHPLDSRLGLVNGLGAEGALFAPALARQWANHLVGGGRFDAEVDVARFWTGPTPPLQCCETSG